MRKKMDEALSEHKDGVNPWPYILGLALIVLAVLALYFHRFHNGFASTADAWGQFGDYFGGVLNPILSFCAFVGLLFTLRGQHSESREVDNRHRAQVYDARLFQLIELFNVSAKSAKGWSNGNSLTGGPGYNIYGHEAVARTWPDLKDFLLQVDHGQEQNPLFITVMLSVNNWRSDHFSNLEGFFHSLILLLRYATFEPVDIHQRKFALDVINGQINSSERVLLFYVLMMIELDVELLSVLVEAGFFKETYQDPLRMLRPKLLKESELNYARIQDAFGD